MAWIGAGLDIEPSAPLVKKQVDPVVGIIEIHDSLMILDHFVDLDSLRENIVVVVVSELGGGSFFAPIGGVVMERKA